MVGFSARRAGGLGGGDGGVRVVHLDFGWFRARPFSQHAGVSGPPRGWLIFLSRQASPFLGVFFGVVGRGV